AAERRAELRAFRDALGEELLGSECGGGALPAAEVGLQGTLTLGVQPAGGATGLGVDALERDERADRSVRRYRGEESRGGLHDGTGVPRRVEAGEDGVVLLERREQNGGEAFEGHPPAPRERGCRGVREPEVGVHGGEDAPAPEAFEGGERTASAGGVAEL